MKFFNSIASKLGYISEEACKKEIAEMKELLQAHCEELYNQGAHFKKSLEAEKEENARLTEQGLDYQEQIKSLKSQLAAEEQERLAKDATLQQIRNILDRHYAM